MRKALVGGVAFAVILVAIVAVSGIAPSWVPLIGGKQSVHIRVVNTLYGSSRGPGEVCLLPVKNVVVKDANGTIVGSNPVEWGKTEVEVKSTVLSCVLDFTISAPRSDFYSIYFDDKLVKTFSRSDAESGVLEVTAD